MKHYEVVTIGSALKDIMFYSDELFVLKNEKDITRQKLLAVEYGAKISIDNVFVNYGGSAMNVAVGLDNFGVRAAPMISVGYDSVGKEIYSYLKAKGISTNLMRVDKKKRTGFSVILTAAKDKEHTIFSYKGASEDLQIFGLRHFRTDWIYAAPLGMKDWAVEFAKIAGETSRGVKIAWNPGKKQLDDWKVFTKFLRLIEILILNKDEAIELVKNNKPKTSKVKLEDSKFLLKAIKGFGARNVVITQGARGAVGIDAKNRLYYEPAQSVTEKIVDTVGAGDAFASGFLAGYIRWNDFSRALTLGIRNSAAVLYRVGAQNGLLKIKL
jgi:sugar/nucleoside kinase (ribokinase family)